jgi:hypothetical protein
MDGRKKRGLNLGCAFSCDAEELGPAGGSGEEGNTGAREMKQVGQEGDEGLRWRGHRWAAW